MINRAVFLVSLLTVLVLFVRLEAEEVGMRVGYFPNITHSQAIVGMANGSFQKELGRDVKIDVKIFNAGPYVIEAMFAGKLDLAYIGPNPAINGYIKSNGEALRIVAGASSGGAALVVRKDSGIKEVKDLHKKRIASPQLGNTQDVSLRAWLKHNDMLMTEKGGDVQVVPVSNPDQLILFLNKQIDAAWTIEPWVSRLVKEGTGVIFLEESSLWPKGEYITANIIVRKGFLDTHPVLVKKWLRTHVNLTQWVNEHLSEAKIIINKELKRLTGAALSEDILNSSFDRLRVTYNPLKTSLFTSLDWAFEQGFLGENKTDISGIYDIRILNEILKEKGLVPLD
ncbi:MAG: ABC transporter substrate-binding protein [Candidatus Omnitrophica bacterium]|nr:ABC transporter substrate-binding protein [Candidatus Omnitrophota bacterium]MBU1922984.1 ABC transporter substrate-binding protein [Candidatus Omnitrophota bacterium]